jgi:integrase
MAKTKSKALNRLTARKVETLKTEGYHHDGGGLYLRVLRSSPETDGVSRSWLFRYTVAGREHWIGLGSAGIVSLADARIARDELRVARHKGRDPLADKQAAKEAAKPAPTPNTMTFRTCAERLIESKRPGWKNLKHAAQWTATLESYVYPICGNLAVQDVDVAKVTDVLEQDVPAANGKPPGRFWEARPETASRVRARVEAVLDWATARGHRKGENPARWRGHLEALLPAISDIRKVERRPSLPWRRIGDFVAELANHSGISADALHFTILTCVRSDETAGARWAEFDIAGKTWVVPRGRHKTGKKTGEPHRVALSKAALAILDRRYKEAGGKPAPDAYVFPGAKPGRHLSDAAMTQLIEGMNGDGDEVIWFDAADGRPIVTHGFRTTFRTWVQDQTKFGRDLAEAALAHTLKDKVEAAYARSDLLDKRRPLMEAWGAFCAKPLKVGGDNVIAIGTKAAAE